MKTFKENEWYWSYYQPDPCGLNPEWDIICLDASTSTQKGRNSNQKSCIDAWNGL